MSFAEDLKAILDRAGDRVDEVVRKTALDLQSSMIEKSPVGNPDLWKGPAPKGYAGGRFKGNWQVGIGGINTSTDSPIDADGTSANATAAAVLKTWAAGQSIYLTNSMPYAQRLEYEGWSSQAPGGMVRLTLQNFQETVAKAAAEVRNT